MSKQRRRHKKFSENDEEEKTIIIHTPGAILNDGKFIFEQVAGSKFCWLQDGQPVYKEALEWGVQDGKPLWYFPLDPIPWAPPSEALDYESEEALWNEVNRFLFDHLDLEDWRAYDVLTGLVFMTWRIEDFSFTCYLYFLGPPASGKTRSLELLAALCYRPLFTASMSSSALFRSVGTWHPTLILDEVQSYLQDNREEFLSLICAGQRRGQYAIRVAEAKEGEPRLELYDVFCVKAMASTRETIDTIASRSIIVNMGKNIKPVPIFIDAERSLKIRNQLLMYRLRTVGKPLPTTDFTAFRDGRVIELFYNLARLAPSDTIREKILAYAKDFETERLEEEKYSFYAQVFEAFMEAYKRDGDPVGIKAVTEILNVNLPEKEKIRESTVGKVLNTIGLKQTVRMSGGPMARKFVKRTALRVAKRYTPNKLKEYFGEGSEGSEGLEGWVSHELGEKLDGQPVNADMPPSEPSQPSYPSQGICNLCGRFTAVKLMWHGSEKKLVCENCVKLHLVRPIDDENVVHCTRNALDFNHVFSDDSRLERSEIIRYFQILGAKKDRVVEIFIDQLWLTALHETLHEVAPELSDEQIIRAALAVAQSKALQFMVWRCSQDQFSLVRAFQRLFYGGD